ncbi:ABC transporter ATP-binding protein [Pseudomonas fluorescens]|uniref:ABC transporter ATP-binding protein n=1 Tax=Pseudomonas fluorescens TaxID=294 RepID=UPI000CA1666A|nr:ABC transporter ATP-binding protein [Pseudomonas fluorescens]AUM70538.1 ABC transporter ATP-binding protein [Pseudomonas fluorescens]
MLRFENVTKHHAGKSAPAVSGLNLLVEEGELCVFVGPSGCGKSTILRMINRLDTLDSGRISINGVDTQETDIVTLRRHVGFMMQKAALFPHKTVEENISAVPRLLKWDKRRIAARVAELMTLVDLPTELLTRYPNQLSGGQQSRVALARALASDPPIILMDEPFGALDPLTRERLQDEFISLHKRLRKTIILVTHDMEEAIKLGQRIAVFEDQGKLVQFDSPENILARPENGFVRQFVGNDPSLRRLALMKVSELNTLEDIQGMEIASLANSNLYGHGETAFKLVINNNREPVRWISETEATPPKLTLVCGTNSLQTALLEILNSPSGVAVQVDDHGRFKRCISMAELHAALQQNRKDCAQ